MCSYSRYQIDSCRNRLLPRHMTQSSLQQSSLHSRLLERLFRLLQLDCNYQIAPYYRQRSCLGPQSPVLQSLVLPRQGLLSRQKPKTLDLYFLRSNSDGNEFPLRRVQIYLTVDVKQGILVMSIHAMNRNGDQSQQKLTVKSVLPIKSTRRTSANAPRSILSLTPIEATKALTASVSL